MRSLAQPTGKCFFCGRGVLLAMRKSQPLVLRQKIAGSLALGNEVPAARNPRVTGIRSPLTHQVLIVTGQA
jgi:hypothetical protein